MSAEWLSAGPGTDAGINLGLGGRGGGEPVSARGIRIGYARWSTERQDLTAQRRILSDVGVADDRVYLDHRLTGRNRSRPGLTQALPALRAGDTRTPSAERPFLNASSSVRKRESYATRPGA
jgi:hypothetical protein